MKKSNRAIALLLGAGILLSSIGRVAGREGARFYEAPDLLLTQGQAEYDLCDGIKYDSKKYELSVYDEGGFDINAPGSYLVEYQLTPVEKAEVPTAPLVVKDPVVPKETGAAQETTAVQEPSSAQETGGPQESSSSQETDEPQESSSSQETGGSQESSSSQETDEPQESSPSQETGGTQESSSSQETGGTQESSSQETGGTQESSSQETGGTQESSSSQETGGTQESSSSQEADGPQESPSSQEAGSTQDSPSSQEAGGIQNSQGTGDSRTSDAQPEQGHTADSSNSMKAQGQLLSPSAVRTANTKFILKEEAPAPEKASPSQGGSAQDTPSDGDSQDTSSREEISFTRVVIVKAAVRYQNVRFDIDTLTDLMTGMDYDHDHYSLSVLDDGGFNGSRIEEYHVIYRLVNTDNGNIVADLERYIWITAPGVTFDAPDLELRLDQADFDLQAGIYYDSDEYALTTVDPDCIDTTQAGKQRAMFHMTAIWPEGTAPAEATSAQAEAAVSDARPVSRPAAAEDAYAQTEPAAPEAASEPTSDEPATAEPAAPETTAASVVTLVTGESAETASSPAAEDVNEGSFETQPVAAIFGRNVNVGTGPVVVIDAPPLIIKTGTEAEHSLLEGVTAEDEDGNPVVLQVANRSELDRAAGNAAGQNALPAQSYSRAMAVEPDQTAGTALQIQAMPLGSAETASPSQATPSDGAETAADSQELPPEGTGLPPESEDLPAGLPQGTYKILLSATHPVTGRVFTAQRMVRLSDVYDNLDAEQLATGTYTRDVSTALEPIYIMPDATVELHLTGTGSIRHSTVLRSPITLAPGSALTLILDPGAQVTLEGQPGDDGSSQQGNQAQGGGCGIRLQKPGGGQQWPSLTIEGSGTLTAIGGNAGAGGLAGGRYLGGGGGGGAGAAIGGMGGSGGAGGGQNNLNGGNGADGDLPPDSQIQISANVTRKNGKDNPTTVRARNDGAASGGGGTSAGIGTRLPTSFAETQADGFGGGAGGAGGGSGGANGYGGFGQGAGVYPSARDQTASGGGSGGVCPYYTDISVAVSAEGDPRILGFTGIGDAFAAVQADASGGIRKNYTVAILRDNVRVSWSEADQIEQMTGLSPDITVTLAGQGDPLLERTDPTYRVYSMEKWGSSSTDTLRLPYSADASASGAFVIRDIGNPFDIVANGSKLTMANTGGSVRGGVQPKDQDTRPPVYGDLTLYNVNSGNITGADRISDHCTLSVAGEVHTNYLYNVDTMTIEEGAKLTVANDMSLQRTQSGQVVNPGDIKMCAQSTLSQTSSSYKAGYHAGSLETVGDGATLDMPTGKALGLHGADPAKLSDHPLRVSGLAQESIDLLFFTDSLTSARSEDYISTFGPEWHIVGNPHDGHVRLQRHRMLLDYPDGSVKGFPNMQTAINAIKADNPPGQLKTGTYTLSLLDNYVMTADDQAALTAATGLSPEATVVISGKYGQDPNAPVRNLTFYWASGAPGGILYLPKGSAGVTGAAFELQNMFITKGSSFNRDNRKIVANGSKLTMGPGISVEVTSIAPPIDLIGGVIELTSPSADFTGNTSLEVLSGTYDVVTGGNGIYGSGTAVQSTVTGDATVHIGGQAAAGKVCGGSYLASGGSSINARRVGNSNVILSDAANVPNLFAKSAAYSSSIVMNSDQVTGTAQILLRDVDVRGAQIAINGASIANQEPNYADLTVSGNCKAGGIYGFQAIHLQAGSSLDATKIDRGPSGSSTGETYARLDFQGGARLMLGQQSSADSFRIEGAGNVLGLPRQTYPTAPLYMNCDTPNERVEGARLELQDVNGMPFVSREMLINFKTVDYAQKEDYINGFGEDCIIGKVIFKADHQDSQTGWIYVDKMNVRLTYPETSGKADEQFMSLGDAMRAVKADEASGTAAPKTYTLTLLSDYPALADDKDGFAAAAGLSPQTTVALTGQDARNPGAPVKKLDMGSANLVLSPGSAGVSGAAFEIRNMIFTNTRGREIVARGSKLTMGEGLVMEGASTPFDLPGLVGGMLENTKDISLTGNTWLEVTGGSYSDIFGGNYSLWDGGNDPTSTINGATVVNVKGSAAANLVCGGSYITTNYGMDGTVIQNGNRTVTLSEVADVDTVLAGSYSGVNDIDSPAVEPGYKAEVILNGVNVSRVSANGSASPLPHGYKLLTPGNVVVTVNGNVSVTDSLKDYQTLALTPGSELDAALEYADSWQTPPGEVVDFQGDAHLSIRIPAGATQAAAGSFRIAESGNTLTLPRTGSGNAPMKLAGRDKGNECIDGARLRLQYQEGVQVQAGDKLLYFANNAYAKEEDYEPEIGGLAVLTNSRGDVYAGYAVSVETNGGAPVFYPSLAKAMAAVGEGTGEYKVTFRQERYALTPADGEALSVNGGKAGKITYTSHFVPTATDPLEEGDVVDGPPVTRTVLVGYGTTSASPKFDLNLNSPNSLVENIRFKYLQEGCSLYSNGHKLVIGSNVDIISDAGYYPTLYGGARNKPVAKTDVTIQSGKYNGIYGGGREAEADVTGDTSVTFGGTAVLAGAIYGGGEAGDVGGTASLAITGGKANAAAAGRTNTVVGGGKTGNAGAASITISAGTADGTVEIAGCDAGNVTADVNILITDSTDSPAPQAPAGNLYGASLRTDQAAGTVGGNVRITITNGKDYGTINGAASVLSPGKTSDITIRGGSSTDGSVTVENILDFDTLNLGDPGTAASRANMFLTGKLQGAEGTLNFYDGSVLSFQGTSTAPEDLVIKNIHTDASSPRSHLHMYKDKTAASDIPVTRPLHIMGQNTSAPEDKLVVGEYGPGQDHGNVGQENDRLLVFADAANANTGDYISDIQGLDIVHNQDDMAVLQLGHSITPSISLEQVQHIDEAGNTTQADKPAATVKKTLTFAVSSFQEQNPTLAGEQLTGAYVDTSWQADPVWAGGGNLPDGAAAVNLTQDAPDSVTWKGTVTMDIIPPAEPNPVYYYAHVRDAVNRVRTIVLDVHSPVQPQSPVVTTDSMGNYTFTVELKDLKPIIPGTGIDYNVFGLKQLAWALGTAAAPAGQEEALQPVMAEGGELKKVTTLDTPSIDNAYTWTFTLTAGDLGQDPSSAVIYLYAKDAMGNTGVYPIPLNGNLMDIKIPTWAGTVALRGGNESTLLAPDLYLVNYGEKPVKAELVGAELPQDQGSGDGKLKLTNRLNGPWDPNELCLAVKPLEGSQGQDYFVPIVDINAGTNAVNLGIMPGRNEANHGAGFTFGAVYDPQNIIKTGGWSQCELTYRFTLEPAAPAAQGQ